MAWKRKILSQDEETQIEEKIKSFEDETGSELIVCVAKACDPYPAAILRFAIIAAFVTSFLASLYLDFAFNYYLILLQFLLLIVFIFVGRTSAVKKYALSQVETEREVDEKALELFFLLGSSQTTHRSSIFLLVSLFEKRIKLLVGRDIKEKLSQEDLDDIVQTIQSEFKRKLFFSGLTKAIDTISVDIKKNFPDKVMSEAPDELENKITWLDFS